MFRYLSASLEKGYALVDAQFGVCACVRIPIHNLEQTKATHFLIEGVDLLWSKLWSARRKVCVKINKKGAPFKSKKRELKEIVTPYITRNGKRIYRKDGRVWHFWVEEKRPTGK